MLKSRELTWYPRNAKTARPSFSLCLCTFHWIVKQITFKSHKTTIVLKLICITFSDNIVLARYIRLKTLPMDILNKFKQFKTELIFFLL